MPRQQQSFSFAGSPSPVPTPLPVRRRRSSAPRRAIAPVPQLTLDLQEVAYASFERRLGELLPGRLTIVLTENRHTVISVRRAPAHYRIRVHRIFTSAPDDVLVALARYVRSSDRRASRLLSSYIEANHDAIHYTAPRRSRRVSIATRGMTHDLQEIFEDLNRRYFDSRVDALITWGRRAGRRRRRSIKMGSYSVEDRLIRIHPALDGSFVPRYFVEWIVYHEMLHQVHDIPVIDGRRRFHTPEFCARERLFEHFERARRWEQENLNRLLNS